MVQQRYERLVEVQEEISWAGNRALEGGLVEVLVSTGEGRKDGATRRRSGRARDGRLVHFDPGPDADAIRPGDVVQVRVGYGAPHHLVADGGVLSHRRTRAGDVHETGTRRGAGAAESGSTGSVRGSTVLGLPAFGEPAVAPVISGCGVREG